MQVRASINGRKYLLDWSEFEKALSNTALGVCVDIHDICVGGAYATA